MNTFDSNYDYSFDAKTISNIMLPKSADALISSVSTRSISHWTEPTSRASAVAGKILIAASIAIGTMIPSLANASDIFVSETRGTTAETPSGTDLSDMIKSSVESMPEHQLVDSEANADYVLRPRLMKRSNGMVLRIDRYRGETFLSSSEEPLSKIESDQDGAYFVVTNSFKGPDAPAPTAASDRAQSPTFADSATGTRGDQKPAPTGAAHTAEMAVSNKKISSDIGANSNSTAGSASGSTGDRPASDVAAPTAENTTGNSLAARVPSSDTSGQDGATTSNDNSQAAIPPGTSADNQPGLSPEDSERMIRGTAATPATPTPDEPMKTAIIPPTPAAPAAPVAAQGNPLGHPMNPGSGVDTPASDFGSSSANEMRTDNFKRTSVFGGPGYYTAAAGAGFAGGLGADNTMVDVNAGYAIDYNPLITGKAFVDMNLGTGADVARFIDLAVGANYYPPQVQSSKSKPYVGGDLGLGMARNNRNDSQSSLAVGATGGFQFLADTANLDVGLRYEVLATQIDGATAQLLGLKVGMNF